MQPVSICPSLSQFYYVNAPARDKGHLADLCTWPGAALQTTIFGTMASRLIVDETRCSGCRACQVACADIHEGAFSVALARLRVDKRDTEGIDQPIVCDFCADAPCAAACPTAALTQRSDGALQLDVSRCEGCGLCAAACPHGALRMHPKTDHPLVCDLCGGEPACVAACVTGALGLEERQ